MLALVLPLALCAAPSVTLLSDAELRALPRPELTVHLHDVEDELGSLRRSLSRSMGEVFLEAGERTAPFVLVSALPLLGLALVFRGLNTTSELLGNALLIAAGAIAVAAVAALVYCIGRVFEFYLVDVPALAAREKELDAYQRRVDAVRAVARP